MNTLAEFKAREAEFRDFTRRWIEAEDKKFKEIEQTEIAKKNKPIRHPKGGANDKHDREYFWRDALYCQDRGSEPFELFFYPDLEDAFDDEFFAEMVDSQGCDSEAGRTWDWMAQVFDEEFRKVVTDLPTVLEG